MNAQRPTLLVDTNVWLDCYLPNRKGRNEATSLVSFAFEHDYPLLYPVAILKDLFYVVAATIKQDVRQQKGTLTAADGALATETAWACVNSIRDTATAVGADESDMWLACKLRGVHEDIEDNLVVAAAQRANATYLVTNDKALIKHAPVATLTPRDALAMLDPTR